VAFKTGDTSIGSDGITVPNYTTATRPANPVNNYVIYNTTTQRLEVYLLGEWKPVYSTGGGGYLYRQIITRSWVMGGYKDTSPWKNVNRMQHSTDVCTNLGDLLAASGAYTSGFNSVSKGFLWSANNTWPGSSTQTVAFNLATETGAGLNSSWNMRTGRNDNGTMFQETYYAYITGGGSADIDVFNATTETMLTDFGTSTAWQFTTTGDNDGEAGLSTVSDQTAGWGSGNQGAGKLTYATSSVTSSPETGGILAGLYSVRYTALGSVHGQQKGISSKLGRGYSGNNGSYNGGYVMRRMVFATETYTTITKPIGNSGEENFDMGQNWQYMLGCYDGAQNNRGWKFTYATDTGVELGAGSVRTGVPGGSSGACVWG